LGSIVERADPRQLLGALGAPAQRGTRTELLIGFALRVSEGWERLDEEDRRRFQELARAGGARPSKALSRSDWKQLKQIWKVLGVSTIAAEAANPPVRGLSLRSKADDDPGSSPPASETGELVCHCRRVTYARVDEAIGAGQIVTLADVQRVTTACTRCFGCRFELERMLKEALGERYIRTPFVTRLKPATGDHGPGSSLAASLPRRMYMPVLEGYRGSDVRTRVAIFHWHDGSGGPGTPIDLRADLLRLDGQRLGVWAASVGPGRTAVLDVRDIPGAKRLTEGVGTLKLVVAAEEVGSLRPYFQFLGAGGASSTHEKSNPRSERPASHNRRYHWVFPVGAGSRPSEAFFFCVNAISYPISGRELVWNAESGESASTSLPELELDQAAFVPLHEAFPAVNAGRTAGTVRLSPTAHVAGHIVRRDPGIDSWRVQHL
jgi:bacterioferritin-associated ferredoxin